MLWLIAANPNKYDIDAAFDELQFIDWTKNANYKKNDIIFIYVSNPVQRIKYICKVIIKKMTAIGEAIGKKKAEKEAAKQFALKYKIQLVNNKKIMLIINKFAYYRRDEKKNWLIQ